MPGCHGAPVRLASRFDPRPARPPRGLTRRLSELEAEWSAVRQEFQQASRELDGRTLELTNLRTTIARESEKQCIELAVSIARRIILKELALKPDEIVKLAKDVPFTGKAALQQIKAKGPGRRLVGFVTDAKGVIPRHGMPVFVPALR